jgi:hypothetical protein
MLLEMGRLSRCNQNADWHRTYTCRRRVGCRIRHREGVGEPTTLPQATAALAPRERISKPAQPNKNARGSSRFGGQFRTWTRTDDFRSTPINRHRYHASACLKCQKATFAIDIETGGLLESMSATTDWRLAVRNVLGN